MNHLRTLVLQVVLIAGTILCAVHEAASVEATVDLSKKYQTIEGFGGGFMFGVWPYNRSYEEALYDSIFNKAGVNVVRVGNFYDPDNDTGVIEELPMMKAVKEKYPDVKVMMSSWSPPANLKEGDTIAGKVDGKQLSLKKNASGQFMYNEYADYWLKSVQYFQEGGLDLDWVSIQNEPDWPADYEGCLFTPTEGAAASYGKALDAVHAKIQTLEKPVPFIGPDVTGPLGNKYPIGQYIDNINLNKLSAVSHHFYNGETETAMRGVQQKVGGTLPIYQTEWLTNEDQARWDGKIWSWFDHLQVVQRALTVENVSMYCIFALAYKTASTHCFFSQDTAAGTYQVRPIYYGFKHFSKSIKRGWKRVDAAAPGLQVSAFANDDEDWMSVVVINTGGATTLSLKGIPAACDSGCAHQSTIAGGVQTKKYEEIARFGATIPEISIDANSVTSVQLWNDAKYSDIVENKVCTVRHAAGAQFSATASGGAITATVAAPADGRYALSLFNAAGRRVAPVVKGFRSAGSKVHRFTTPVASGVYMVVLESAGISRSVPVVVR